MDIGQGITFGAGVNITPQPPPSSKAIFSYGYSGFVTNLVSTTGVVANDVAGVGTSRVGIGAAGYGIDKAIFGFGGGPLVSTTNLVSNTGVVGNDVTGVGSPRYKLSAATYGTDKAIFGPGGTVDPPYYTTVTNLVSNTGVVASNTSGVAGVTYSEWRAAAGYGTDKAIFGYGSGPISITNLISNTGVMATDTAGVGTARGSLAAAGYGSDKAVFGFGNTGSAGAPTPVSITNKVSNTGVVAADTTGVGTARYALAAAGYGVDTAIFGYGQSTVGTVSVTNKVSNTGVVAIDTTGVGTARFYIAAASYGLS